MQKKFKLIALSTMFLGTILVLAGCGSSSADKKVTTVSVGVPNDGYPFGYMKGKKLDGYDVSVVKAVYKKLKNYQFKYQASDFPTALSNLGSNKVTLSADEYEKNAERQKKFLYSTVGYSVWDTYIVTPAKAKTASSFADMKGKKIYAQTSTNQAAAAQAYLKAHPGAFHAIYGNYTTEQIVQALTSGQVDATLAPKYQVDSWNRSFHKGLKIGSKPIHKSDAYLLFNKSANKQFVSSVNKAMGELKKDGTLVKLSNQYLKGDYVPK